MTNASLVVHEFSYGFVRRFVDHLHAMMQRYLGSDTPLILCDTVDAAAYRDGLVFVIGENLPVFEPRPGCTYAYLNLSVVSLLGSPFAASVAGHRQVFRKRRMLARKLPLFDVLLDYYPPQTERLQTSLSLPVLGFDVAVEAGPPPDSAPEYDVCFVGGLTARRQKVLREIEALGLRLSPFQGAPIEEFAARSRVCLNIHTERSNHLEVPRFVAALSTGCPVVTETSFGVADLQAGEAVIERPLADVNSAIVQLLSDPEKLNALKQRSFDWYTSVYLPRAEARWQKVFDTVAAVHDDQSTTLRRVSSGH